MKWSILNLKRWFGYRHIQFFMLFFDIFISFGIRTNMSMAIIAMISENPPNSNIPTYTDWTEKDTILSAFFWGYVIPQICAGALVQKFGSKWFLFVTSLLNSLLTMLIPVLAASFGQTGVIVCRAFQGFCQGFLYPCSHNLLGKWTPVPELSRVASFVYTGGSLGIVFSMPITGLIANSYVGWPVVFYLYGCLGIVWCAVWAYVGADSPDKHGRVSQKEQEYIKENIRNTQGSNKGTPWKSILTSPPVLAILVTQCGQNWGFWTLLTEIPTYMNSILKFDMTNNSLLSALPYFVLWLLSFVFSQIADSLISRKIMSTTNVRKLFQSIGVMVPAITLVVLAFVNTSNKDLAVGLLVIAVGINAGVYSGFMVNHIDLSPNHAGIIMGITNSISNICSIVSPLMLNFIPYEENDPILWRYVFCIAAGFYTVTNVCYLIFASGELQSWND